MSLNNLNQWQIEPTSVLFLLLWSLLVLQRSTCKFVSRARRENFRGNRMELSQLNSRLPLVKSLSSTKPAVPSETLSDELFQVTLDDIKVKYVVALIKQTASSAACTLVLR